MNRNFLYFAACGIILCFSGGTLFGTTRYVAASNPNPVPPYLSWSTAATNIQAVIDVSTDGDLILVTNGTYLTSTQIEVTNAITIRGINGPTNIVVDANYSSRIFYLHHESAVLDGLTLKRSGPNGAIYALAADRIQNCNLISNIYTTGIFPALFGRSVIVSNVLIDRGYGTFALEVESNSLVYSTRITDAGRNGIKATLSKIIDSQIINSVDQGLYASAAEISNCLIADSGDRGAYLAASLMENCTIWSNSIGTEGLFDHGDKLGGGISSHNSTILNCRVQFNEVRSNSDALGGGIYATESWLEGILITHNKAVAGIDSYGGRAYGGGIYAPSNNYLFHCTIAYNNTDYYYSDLGAADSHGGGAYFRYANFLVNSILWGNTNKTDRPDSDNYEGDTPSTYFSCLSPAPANSIQCIDTDPLLVNISGADYELSGGSMCIERGLMTLNSKIDQDLQGAARPLDANWDGFASYDIGATEYSPTNFIGLYGGGVWPAFGGSTSTVFKFQTYYQDVGSSNHLISAEVVISGSNYPLTLLQGTPSNGLYHFETSLPFGQHEFKFLFSGTQTNFQRPPPDEGDVYTGLVVSTVKSITNPQVQPSSGPVGTEFQFCADYTDLSVGTPATIWLQIHGNRLPMTLVSGTASEGTYCATKGLYAPGTYPYSFVLWDPNGYVETFPSGGSYTGPTVTQPPPGPTALQASDGTELYHISISWSNVTDAEGYKLYRGTNTSFEEAQLLGETTGLSTNDIFTLPGISYFYWVSSTNTAMGEGPPSGPEPGSRGVSNPTDIEATEGTCSNCVRVSWTSAFGSTGYSIWRNLSNTLSGAAVLTSNYVPSLYYDNLVEGGLPFYYWVSSEGPSVQGPEGSGTLGFAPLDAPEGVNASDGAFTNRVAVSWSLNGRAESYSIRKNHHNDFPSSGIIATGVLTATYDDLNPGDALYYYWVTGENELGLGNWSTADLGWRAAGPLGHSYVQPATNSIPSLFAATMTDHIYAVWSISNLTSGIWTQMPGTEMQGDGSLMEMLIIPNPSENGLFRIQASPNP